LPNSLPTASTSRNGSQYGTLGALIRPNPPRAALHPRAWLNDSSLPQAIPVRITLSWHFFLALRNCI
jgi:hypothetical protein